MVISLILLHINDYKNQGMIGKYYLMVIAVLLLTYSAASTIILIVFLIYFLFTKGRFKSWFLLFILFSILLIANTYEYYSLIGKEGELIFRKYTLNYFFEVFDQKIALFF